MIKGTHGSRWYTHSSSRCRCDNTIFMLFSGLGELQFFRCGLLLPSTCAMCCKDTTINEWQQEISFTKIKRQVSQRGKSPTWFWLWLLFFFFFGFWQSCRILLLAYFSFFFISLFRSMEHDDQKHTYIHSIHIYAHNDHQPPSGFRFLCFWHTKMNFVRLAAIKSAHCLQIPSLNANFELWRQPWSNLIWVRLELPISRHAG